MVGTDVDVKCGRCKLVLAHIVLSTVNGLPVRVQCNTCRSERPYRAPKAEPLPREPREKAAPKEKTPRPDRVVARFSSQMAPGAQTASPWATLSQGREESARPYSPAEIYTPGELLSHPKFALGYVQARTAPGKISVLFQSGAKVLIDSRS